MFLVPSLHTIIRIKTMKPFLYPNGQRWICLIHHHLQNHYYGHYFRTELRRVWPWWLYFLNWNYDIKLVCFSLKLIQIMPNSLVMDLFFNPVTTYPHPHTLCFEEETFKDVFRKDSKPLASVSEKYLHKEKNCKQWCIKAHEH